MRLEGLVAILRWGPRFSHYIGGSSLLVEDEVENICVAFENWVSPVQIYQNRAGFSLLEIWIRMKTCQEVKVGKGILFQKEGRCYYQE